MAKKKRKTISHAAREFEQERKQKKKTKWQRKIKGFQSFVDKSVAPRYEALESKFYRPMPKRKSVKKKKKLQAKYYIYKGKAYPIVHTKK